jgi:hypothetical protein
MSFGRDANRKTAWMQVSAAHAVLGKPVCEAHALNKKTLCVAHPRTLNPANPPKPTVQFSPKLAISKLLYIITVLINSNGEVVNMILDSGLKAIDNLVKKFGLVFGEEDNLLQKSVYVPATGSRHQLRQSICTFGLNRFPHSIWLKLLSYSANQNMTVYRFSLPQVNHQVFCWLLIDEHGHLVELACPINKKKYIDASKCIARELQMLYPSDKRLQQAHA